MKDIKNILIDNLGFSDKKALVYLTLLELGEAVVVDVAKKANLKRTTVYNILPELIQEGLVKITKKDNKKYFFVEDPRQLKTEAEEKLSNIEKIVPELQSIQSILPYSPKVIFLEGIGGMKDLYEDVIKNVKPGDEILSFIGSINIYQFVPKEVGKRYIDSRIRKKVINRIITSDTQVSKDWQESAKKELRIIKVVDKKFNFQADMKIYSNKVAFLSFKENFMGVIMESSEINKLQKAAFEMMWENI